MANKISKQGDLVRWNGKLHKLISINMGGKCRIRRFSSNERKFVTFGEIDISELELLDDTTTKFN